MLRRLSTTCLYCLVLLFGVGIPAVSAGSGTIDGVVQYVKPDGQVIFGDWVRVLLVREHFKPPSVGDLSKLSKNNRVNRIIDAHIGFFKRFREKMAQPEYLVAETMTTPDGSFRFSDIEPGLYYVVVTFPSMVQGYKVAWQVPVRVTDGQRHSVELSNANMAIPSYSRERSP